MPDFFLVAMSYMAPTFSQEYTFDNPIAEKRADPWVYKDSDGTYYLIATVPEYDKIVIRKAKTINGLKEAEEKVIWLKHGGFPDFRQKEKD